MKKRPLPKGAKIFSPQAQPVFKGVRYEVFQWQQKQFNGKIATYETVRRNDSVIVLPIIKEKIILLKESQPHWDKEYLGFVAGGAEQDEDILEAAHREVKEETGMVFENYYLVHANEYCPGIEWFGYTFIATGLISKGPKDLDDGEKNDQFSVSVDELMDLVRLKSFLFRPAFLEDYLVRGKEKELRNLFTHPEKYAIEF